MKKSLFVVFITTAILATSCQKGSNGKLTNESIVKFSVEAPEIGTRAFGDGTIANDLYYGIYDEAGNLVSAISKIDDNNKSSINISTTITLKLVTGNTYSMIFWADNANDVCDIDFAAKTMSFIPESANQETYDAFWAYVEPFKVEDNITKTVKLYRPFAQLNIGTNDIEDASNAGMTVAESLITVTTPTLLNLVTGEVSEEQTVSYAFASTPEEETFPVEGYEYLSMNYLLVGAEKSTIDVEFGYADEESEYSREFSFVPVQRNYRTNIFGSILTSDVNVNIIIEPAFNEPDYIINDESKSEDDNKAENGGETVEGDVDMAS